MRTVWLIGDGRHWTRAREQHCWAGLYMPAGLPAAFVKSQSHSANDDPWADLWRRLT